MRELKRKINRAVRYSKDIEIVCGASTSAWLYLVTELGLVLDKKYTFESLTERYGSILRQIHGTAAEKLDNYARSRADTDKRYSRTEREINGLEEEVQELREDGVIVGLDSQIMEVQRELVRYDPLKPTPLLLRSKAFRLRTERECAVHERAIISQRLHTTGGSFEELQDLEKIERIYIRGLEITLEDVRTLQRQLDLLKKRHRLTGGVNENNVLYQKAGELRTRTEHMMTELKNTLAVRDDSCNTSPNGVDLEKDRYRDAA